MKNVRNSLLLGLLLSLSGCFGGSPCEIKQEDMGRFVLVNITNTSSKPVKIEAQSGKVALSVQKEIDGDWIYDMFNMTRKGGYVKVSPKETVVIRKYISKRDKSLKYRFELKCDGKKIKTDEF